MKMDSQDRIEVEEQLCDRVCEVAGELHNAAHHGELNDILLIFEEVRDVVAAVSVYLQAEAEE